MCLQVCKRHFQVDRGPWRKIRDSPQGLQTSVPAAACRVRDDWDGRGAPQRSGPAVAVVASPSSIVVGVEAEGREWPGAVGPGAASPSRGAAGPPGCGVGQRACAARGPVAGSGRDRGPSASP